MGPFCHSLWNRFGGPNLGATVGVEAKKLSPKNRGSTQIKSRGLVLGATAGVALGRLILSDIRQEYACIRALLVFLFFLKKKRAGRIISTEYQTRAPIESVGGIHTFGRLIYDTCP